MDKQFMSINDIKTVLGCSYSKAQEIAHMLLNRGYGLRDGKMIRIQIKKFMEYAGLKEG